MHTLIAVVAAILSSAVTLGLLVILRRMTIAYHAERFPRRRVWFAYGLGIWMMAGGLIEAPSRLVYAAPAGAITALIGLAVFTTQEKSHRQRREDTARALSEHQDFVDEWMAGGHLGVALNALRRRRDHWRQRHNH
jgi:hypothetical protein